MCDFLSGWVVRESHGSWMLSDVVVRDLVSHMETARIAQLNADKANEWEWTGNDPASLTVRRSPDDPHNANYYRACVLSHGETRLDFLNWLFDTEAFQNYGGGLSLDGLTSAEGLTLPKEIGGGLYLNGLTGAERERIMAAR